MKNQILIRLLVLLLAGIPVSSPSLGQSRRNTITLSSANAKTEIPLDGLKANQEAIDLAKHIADSQKAFSRWQTTIDTSDPVTRRMTQLVAILQADSIRQLDAGYKTAATTSGNFPNEAQGEIKQLLELCAKIFSKGPKFEDRVVTHISTTVKNASLHFRPYSRGTDFWSTYSDGQILEIGAYYFRVTSNAAQPYEERVVVIDNPQIQQITP